MMLSLLVFVVPLLLFFSSRCQEANGFSPTLKRVRQHQDQQQSSFRALHSIPTPFDTLTSGLASMCRLPRGIAVDETASIVLKKAADDDDNNNNNNNVVLLAELYNIENDVHCRKVRERITELDLCVERVICASAKSRVMSTSPYKFTVPQLVVHERKQRGGDEGEPRQQVQPQVIILSGAKDILDYLNSKFVGNSGIVQQDDDDANDSSSNVLDILLNLWNVAGNYAATALRLGRGMDRVSAAGNITTTEAITNNDDSSSSSPRLPVARKRRQPPRQLEKPLVLYDYEGNQFSRLVREVLHELDLVYELRTVGKDSPRRQTEMVYLTDNNSTQCPFLIDPNPRAIVRLQDSTDIIAYLYKTYALWAPPNEQLQWISNNFLEPLFQPFFAWQAKLQAGVVGDDGNNALLAEAKAEIQATIAAHAVCIYTYEWMSPFSSQAKSLLDNLNIAYHEISLGRQWIPGLINKDGAALRAALLDMTGQSSLPHVFINGKSIGGLFSGTPGLVPGLEQQGILVLDIVSTEEEKEDTTTPATRPTKATTTETTAAAAAAAARETSLSKQTARAAATTTSVVKEETTGDFQ